MYLNFFISKASRALIDVNGIYRIVSHTVAQYPILAMLETLLSSCLIDSEPIAEPAVDGRCSYPCSQGAVSLKLQANHCYQ